MNRRGFLKGLTGLSLCPLCASPGSAQHEWSYADPGKWSEAYPACAGNMQSPMEASEGVEYRPSVNIAWADRGDKVINTGHYIKVTFPNNDGGKLTIDTESYTLNQFHFHCPSEHRSWRNEEYPMEIHFVHNEDGPQTLVLAVLARAIDLEWSWGGQERKQTFRSLAASVPREVNGSASAAEINPKYLLPISSGDPGGFTYGEPYHRRYKGSLTTPPCRQDIDWVVLRDEFWVSPELLTAISTPYPRNARRPKPQPLFGWRGGVRSYFYCPGRGLGEHGSCASR